jgi:peptide/nickel transport system substrate-binding protein
MKVSRRSVLGSTAAWLPGLSWAEAPARKVLVMANSNDITNFDPHTNTDEPTTTLLRSMYDALVTVSGENASISPCLARSWSASEAGTEFTFQLDPRARFHDGSPVTAAAVAYSFERLLRINKGNAWMIAGLVEPGGAQAVDEHTFKIKLARPFGALLQVLPWIWVVNPKLVEANKGADDGQTFLRKTVAGSGPFSLRRAEPGNLYELERVTNGWDKGTGNTSVVLYKIVRESGTQRLMLQRGEVHVAANLTSDDTAALTGKPGVSLVIRPEFRMFLFRMNTKHGPLADVNLRRAVSCAIDYNAMKTVAVHAKTPTGPLPEGMFGYFPGAGAYALDLAKAKSWLAKSNYAGKPVQLTVAHISGYEQQRRWCLILMDNLRKIGVDAEIKALTWPDIVGASRSPETCPDFLSVFTSVNYADPADISFNHYHSSRNGNWSNPTYANPAVDKLIDEGRSEMNRTKRERIYAEFQKAVMADAPDLFIVNDYRKIGVRSNVGGFVYCPVRPGAIAFAPLSLT